MALHDAAIKDEYFVKRRLAPNVDFWYVCSFCPVTYMLTSFFLFFKISGGQFFSLPLRAMVLKNSLIYVAD